MSQITCPSCGVSSQQVGRYCQHCAQPLQSVQPLGRPQPPYPQPPHVNRTQVFRDERTRIAAREHPKIILLLILFGVIVLGAILGAAGRRGKDDGPSGTASASSSDRDQVKAGLEVIRFTWRLAPSQANSIAESLKCEATVRNNTADRTITGISWLLEFYNQADGKKVEELSLLTSKGIDEYLKILPGETKSITFILGDEIHEESYLQAHRIVLAKAGRVLTATAKISSYKSSAFDPAVDKKTPDGVSLFAE